MNKFFLMICLILLRVAGVLKLQVEKDFESFQFCHERFPKAAKSHKDSL
jgi:hypothetical protein